jgi:uncharacterized protein
MVPSPCKNICVKKNNICVGCGRTVEEIGRWMFFSDEEKEECVHKAKSRLDNS